ncbi:hypothetical protein ATL40_1551 [Serinibacter salmoneus]|uniref:Polyketide cyclase/dehydrase/lipid transport protein n=2 Tax=Serinibacter salmoneus TaxID=556530 RepID=A0A2A9D0Q6_9MICO|nr:hypothetical protein ATL40_1551 [Serinibacter salmoneus]
MWHFTSAWPLPVDTTRAWEVLTDTPSWPHWWPGLRVVPIRTTEHGWIGARSALDFRAPGYRLRLGLEVSEAQPPQRPGEPAAVVLRAVGDLRGVARARIEPTGVAGAAAPSCLVRIDWRVRTVRPALRVGERLAPWALAASHAHVMSAGERGLRTYLETPGRPTR